MNENSSNDEEDMNEKKSNLAKPSQNNKHKFAPYTRNERKERREEVYKLHFEHGMPATKIAELMKVDRHTIDNDLKILYKKAIMDYDDYRYFEEIIDKQLVRLESQRDRLGLYLCDTKTNISNKIAIERLLADIDLKIIGVIDRMGENIIVNHDEIIEKVNKIAEDEGLKGRYTSNLELYRISIQSRQDLDKIIDIAWGKQQEQVQEQTSEEEKPHIVRK